MNSGKTVFAQILEHVPRYEFDKSVKRYRGQYRHRRFSCYDQFLCLAFAQLTYRESLRDIETCLNSHHEKLYHIGFRSPVSRSTLADANERRDYRIFQDFGYHLIQIALRLYQGEELAIDLKEALYALDSTTIDLCLSLFPWATFRKTKSAIKIHTLLNLRGAIPTFISLTPASVHDVQILDVLPLQKKSVLAMDRGYVDFQRLYRIHSFPAFFVTRAKDNLRYRRLSSQPLDKTNGLRSDQRIVLKNKKSREAYPEAIRRVSFIDLERKKRLVFLTNLFTLSAQTVADIYKQRWQVELFFKWIKQHLRIKAFYGTSENAVKTQIWIAVSIYALVAIVKKRLRLDQSLYTILQILSLTLFERIPLYQAVTNSNYTINPPVFDRQLKLFSI